MKERRTCLNNLAAVASFSRNHINYQANTIYDGVKGIMDVDRMFDVPSVTDSNISVGRVSLRMIMYTKLTFGELPLFLEIHQGEPMMPVDVVVGNCPEAERMLLMINKNPAAYFYYYLRDVAKLDADWLVEVISKSFEPMLVRDIDKCKWEASGCVLTTPEDEVNAQAAALEKAAWYIDEFGGSMFDMGEKEKKEFSSKEQLEDLYEDKSFQTVTKGKIRGSKVGVRFAGEEDTAERCAQKGGSGEQDYSKLSKEKLIELLMSKAGISSNSGSQPSGSKQKADASSSDGSDESSEGSSDSDSSMSAEKEIPAPSGGVNTGGTTSAHRE